MNISQDQLSRNLIIGLLIVVCTIAGLSMNPILVWGGLIAGICGMLLLGRPVFLLISYWVWCTFCESIFLSTFASRGSFLRLVSRGLMLGLVATIFLSYVMRRFSDPRIKSNERWFFFLGFSMICASILGDVQTQNMILAFFDYYAFPFVFLASIAFLPSKKSFIERIPKIAISVIYLSFPLHLLSYMNVLPWTQLLKIFDRARGFFYSHGTMGFYAMAMLFMSFGMMLKAETTRSRRNWFIGAAASALTFFITFSLHMYVYLILLYLIYIVAFPAKRGLKLGVLILSLGLFFFAILLAPVVLQVNRSDFSEIMVGEFDLKKISRISRTSVVSPKQEIFEWLVVRNMSELPMEWAFGNGVGMGVGRTVMTRPTPAAYKYLGEFYFSISGQQQMGTSATTSPRFGLMTIWADLGAFGTCAYFGIYFFSAFHLWRNVLRGAYKNRTQGVLAESAVLWLALMVMGNCYSSDFFWRQELISGLWITVALAWSPLKVPLEQKEQKEQGSTVFGNKLSEGRG